MSRGRLYRLAGLLPRLEHFAAILGVFSAPAEIPDEIAAVLAATAERYLRAGGRVTWATWAGLSACERAAFVVAGQRIDADRASATGYASQGLTQALETHGLLDGGRAGMDVAMRLEAERIAVEAGRNPVRR